MYWLSKLPTELKLYISKYCFDALAWFMLDDDSIYEYIKQRKEIFTVMFTDHETSSWLLLPLFDKLTKDNFLPLTLNPLIPVLMSGTNYIYKYLKKSKVGTDDMYLSILYVIEKNGAQKWTECNKKMYSSLKQNLVYTLHRSNALDGKPLPAIITYNGEKWYYNQGTQFYPVLENPECIIFF